MAFFGLFRGTKNTEVSCKRGNGNIYKVVGAAHYQSNLLLLAGGRKQVDGVELDVIATLKPEPRNPHDSNAITVHIENKHVGYLNKKDAHTFGVFLKKARANSAVCDALIVGGWDDMEGDEGLFGVKLSMSKPPKLDD